MILIFSISFLRSKILIQRIIFMFPVYIRILIFDVFVWQSEICGTRNSALKTCIQSNKNYKMRKKTKQEEHIGMENIGGLIILHLLCREVSIYSKLVL